MSQVVNRAIRIETGPAGSFVGQTRHFELRVPFGAGFHEPDCFHLISLGHDRGKTIGQVRRPVNPGAVIQYESVDLTRGRRGEALDSAADRSLVRIRWTAWLSHQPCRPRSKPCCQGQDQDEMNEKFASHVLTLLQKCGCRERASGVP
jgi:hypothetical protein